MKSNALSAADLALVLASGLRFWSFVSGRDGPGCWEWSGARVEGYGSFYVRPGLSVKAHRAAWMLAAGGDVPVGMMLCHRCDNPACVCPEHLFPGTARDNLRDASRKGRLAYSDERRRARSGEGNPFARLTWAAAREIRARRAAGATYRELCDAFGVGSGTIAAVLTGRTWKEDQRPHSAA